MRAYVSCATKSETLSLIYSNDVFGLLLDLGSYLNLFDALMILGISLPTLYVIAGIKIAPLRILFISFSVFLILHGLYHLTYFLSDYTGVAWIGLGNVVLEPLSYVALLSFAIYFARRGG
jgi:hypothetical protein